MSGRGDMAGLSRRTHAFDDAAAGRKTFHDQKEMMQKMWEYRRRVRYYETDRMGVVHHSNYLRFLEDARMDWIRDHIITYSEMEKMGIIIPVVSATGNFKSFLRYDDEFAVRVFPVKFTGVRIRLRYEVYNTETGALCYDGESEHYLAEDGDYRPMSIKRKYPELYEAFCKAMNDAAGDAEK